MSIRVPLDDNKMIEIVSQIKTRKGPKTGSRYHLRLSGKFLIIHGLTAAQRKL